MAIKFSIATFILIILFSSCSKEYNCSDSQITPAFINYLPSDIDTFVLRKFKAKDNYQTLIDTFVVKRGYNTNYQTFNDTTSVSIPGGVNGIIAGFDWQLFIPAKNKTVLISDIISEKETGRRGWGIFSMDPGSFCYNNIYSAKIDNQLINFPNFNNEIGNVPIYIR